MNPDDVRKTARLAYKLGLRVIPPREDGTKRPVAQWKKYQTEQPDPDQMKRWFTNGHTPHGIGLITGGRLECLEFEDRDTWQRYRDTAEAGGLGDVITRIETGYMESTPGGGIHWLYYCDEVSGNTKLASRPTEGQLREHWPTNVDVLIETRGNGGYIIIAPSHGPVHESGRAYELISGGLDTIAEISPDERQELFLLAQAFDEMPKRDAPSANISQQSNDAHGRPGDDYTNQTSWPDLLQPWGWTFVYQRGETQFWRRPGKNIGISATINGEGIEPDRLYVFTSSTEFEPMRSYTRFQAYAVLEHQGDFHAAAKALKQRGYGEQSDAAKLIRGVLGPVGESVSQFDDETDDDEEPDQPPAPRFRIYHSSEFISREPPKQLIRGVMVDQAHAALIGNSGTYKSFIALEMALRIANGGLWYGYPVEQGPTLFISGEGQASFGNRIKAWEIARQENHNIWILPEAIQFPDLRDIEDLLRAMDHYINEQPRLIVIDTLARSAVGKDENSSQDMGLYIKGVDLIMQQYGCAALTLHHANKQGMYRGSSALRAAWDTVLETKQGDDGHSIILSCDKQKDLDPFKPIILNPDQVTIREGKGMMPPLTSVVMNEESSGILTQAAKTALQILTDKFPDGTMNQAWETECTSAGISRSQFFRSKKQLLGFGLIETGGGMYYPTEMGAK